jgi:hypothetical protein
MYVLQRSAGAATRAHLRCLRVRRRRGRVPGCRAARAAPLAGDRIVAALCRPARAGRRYGLTSGNSLDSCDRRAARAARPRSDDYSRPDRRGLTSPDGARAARAHGSGDWKQRNRASTGRAVFNGVSDAPENPHMSETGGQPQFAQEGVESVERRGLRSSAGAWLLASGAVFGGPAWLRRRSSCGGRGAHAYVKRRPEEPPRRGRQQPDRGSASRPFAQPAYTNGPARSRPSTSPILVRFATTRC